jgi:hypothetical protein
MWQVHARFRIGSYEFSEIDITPALGCSLNRVRPVPGAARIGNVPLPKLQDRTSGNPRP